MSYLTSTSLKALLKKEIGFSIPYEFFRRRKTTSVSLEEKEKRKNSLE